MRVRRQEGEHLATGEVDRAGDVDAFAARLAREVGEAVHAAAGQRGGQSGGAVEARVRREGDDHAQTTSIPEEVRRCCSVAATPLSVMRTSISETVAKARR